MDGQLLTTYTGRRIRSSVARWVVVMAHALNPSYSIWGPHPIMLPNYTHFLVFCLLREISVSGGGHSSDPNTKAVLLLIYCYQIGFHPAHSARYFMKYLLLPSLWFQKYHHNFTLLESRVCTLYKAWRCFKIQNNHLILHYTFVLFEKSIIFNSWIPNVNIFSIQIFNLFLSV